MRDYWLSKLFFDLQTPSCAAEYKADRAAVLARYPLAPEARTAVMNDDVEALSKRVNPYLLRFYFVVVGMSEADFVARLRAIKSTGEVAHG